MGPAFSAGKWRGKPSKVEFVTACQLGEHEVVREYRGDVNRNLEGMGKSPICIAASFGRTQVVRELAAKGADLNCTHLPISPLQLAIEGQHRDIVRLLVEELGVDVNATRPGGSPAIASCRSVSMVRFLIAELNADPNQSGSLLPWGGYSLMMDYATLDRGPMVQTIAKMAWEAGWEFDVPAVVSTSGLCSGESWEHNCGAICSDWQYRMRDVSAWTLTRGFAITPSCKVHPVAHQG